VDRLVSDTTLIRYAGTRDQAHAAILAANDQAKLLVSLERRVKITVEEAEDEITILQRGFLHKAVFPQIEEQYRHPDGTRTEWRAWKEYFRARFLGDRWVQKRVPRWDEKLGRMVLPKRKTPHRERVSTEDLGVKKYSAYIDLVIDTATVELGVQFRFITAERDAVRWVAQPRKSKPASRDAEEARQPEEATT
jgi:hypothetical protein